MRAVSLRPIINAIAVLLCLTVAGCAWPMLDRTALEDPIQAVGGSGQVFSSGQQRPVLRGQGVDNATPSELLAYYAPVYVQHYAEVSKKGFRYDHDSDLFGEPYLVQLPNGRLITKIDITRPSVYGIYDSRRIGESEHVQLTYTLWYPRHPRTKRFDIEPGNIDSGVVRITLDHRNRPLIYETALACGCYHKVFIERHVEEASAFAFGPPEQGKKYSIEKKIPRGFDFEVAGIVETPYDQPVPPVVFITSGEHKIIGLHSSDRLNWPQQQGDLVPYRLASYSELEQVPISGTNITRSMFDASNDQQVLGAERLERYIFAVIGTDDAGHPRRNDQILLHFDQSAWMDPNLLHKYLRLPPGLL